MGDNEVDKDTKCVNNAQCSDPVGNKESAPLKRSRRVAIDDKQLRRSVLYAEQYDKRKDGFRILHHAYIQNGEKIVFSNTIYWTELEAVRWIKRNIKGGWEGHLRQMWMRAEVCECKEVFKWLAIARYFRLRAEDMGLSVEEGDKVVDEISMKYRDEFEAKKEMEND